MDVLVGHTGLVGSTLVRQRRFDLRVHRANLHELQGIVAERLFLSALPAEKWRINADPAADLANMAVLQAALRHTRARQVVLVSTVDVYERPVDVDEDSAVGAPQPYGAHRFAFENWVREHFDQVLVLRLPGLFGPGLKKNALHDLLHDHQVERLHPQGRLQWYPLERLSGDIDRALAAGLRLVNASVEPLGTADIASRVFGRRLGHAVDATAPLYRMRSRHARLFGGDDGYWIRAEEAWSALAAWHRAARSGREACPAT